MPKKIPCILDFSLQEIKVLYHTIEKSVLTFTIASGIEADIKHEEQQRAELAITWAALLAERRTQMKLYYRTRFNSCISHQQYLLSTRDSVSNSAMQRTRLESPSPKALYLFLFLQPSSCQISAHAITHHSTNSRSPALTISCAILILIEPDSGGDHLSFVSRRSAGGLILEATWQSSR